MMIKATLLTTLGGALAATTAGIVLAGPGAQGGSHNFGQQVSQVVVPFCKAHAAAEHMTVGQCVSAFTTEHNPGDIRSDERASPDASPEAERTPRPDPDESPGAEIERTPRPDLDRDADRSPSPDPDDRAGHDEDRDHHGRPATRGSEGRSDAGSRSSRVEGRSDEVHPSPGAHLGG